MLLLRFNLLAWCAVSLPQGDSWFNSVPPGKYNDGTLNCAAIAVLHSQIISFQPERFRGFPLSHQACAGILLWISARPSCSMFSPHLAMHSCPFNSIEFNSSIQFLPVGTGEPGGAGPGTGEGSRG